MRRIVKTFTYLQPISLDPLKHFSHLCLVFASDDFSDFVNVNLIFEVEDQ
jgi:hypothetical protein